MHYYDGGWDSGEWFAMILVMLVIWGGVVALVVGAVRGGRRYPDDEQGRPPVPTVKRPPMDVLTERFARGDIDADEFRRSRELLT